MFAVCIEAFVLGFARRPAHPLFMATQARSGMGPCSSSNDVLGVEQSERVLGRPFLDVDHHQGKNQSSTGISSTVRPSEK